MLQIIHFVWPGISSGPLFVSEIAYFSCYMAEQDRHKHGRKTGEQCA